MNCKQTIKLSNDEMILLTKVNFVASYVTANKLSDYEL